MPQPGFGIDVDVRADARRAGREEHAPARATRRRRHGRSSRDSGARSRCGRRGAASLLRYHGIPSASCRGACGLRRAGQRERARAVLDRAAGGRVERQADAHDAIAFDQDVERGVGVRRTLRISRFVMSVPVRSVSAVSAKVARRTPCRRSVGQRVKRSAGANGAPVSLSPRRNTQRSAGTPATAAAAFGACTATNVASQPTAIP